MSQNPHHLPQNHPVRTLLSASAKGRRLTTKDLEVLDQAEEHLPHGESFSRVKSNVISASNEIAALAAEGRTGEAREMVADTIGELGPKLSESARAMNTSDFSGQSLDDLAADLYQR